MRKKYLDGSRAMRKLHAIMSGIRQRCNNATHPVYRWYGARGIKCEMDLGDLCRLWIQDEAWRLKKASVDRIDNDGNYSLYNCRFIELSENVKKMLAERRAKKLLNVM